MQKKKMLTGNVLFALLMFSIHDDKKKGISNIIVGHKKKHKKINQSLFDSFPRHLVCVCVFLKIFLLLAAAAAAVAAAAGCQRMQISPNRKIKKKRRSVPRRIDMDKRVESLV